MYLAFHSYGQYFMFPYGYTPAPVPEYDGLVSRGFIKTIHMFVNVAQSFQMSVSEKYKEAVAVKFGTEYSIGPSSTTICEFMSIEFL